MPQSLNGKPQSSCRSGRFGGARSRGFTAIEVMLVVAVVGILAAIAIPAYQSYQDRVATYKAVTDIQAIQTMIYNYKADNRTLPANLGQVGAANMRDPWGNPYQYTNLEDVNGNGEARKNKNLVPINSDFDLWSNGKDGASVSPLTGQASRDDIVRANDGRFVGLASDFDP